MVGGTGWRSVLWRRVRRCVGVSGEGEGGRVVELGLAGMLAGGLDISIRIRMLLLDVVLLPENGLLVLLLVLVVVLLLLLEAEEGESEEEKDDDNEQGTEEDDTEEGTDIGMGLAEDFRPLPDVLSVLSMLSFFSFSILFPAGSSFSFVLSGDFRLLPEVRSVLSFFSSGLFPGSFFSIVSSGDFRLLPEVPSLQSFFSFVFFSAGTLFSLPWITTADSPFSPPKSTPPSTHHHAHLSSSFSICLSRQPSTSTTSPPTLPTQPHHAGASPGNIAPAPSSAARRIQVSLGGFGPEGKENMGGRRSVVWLWGSWRRIISGGVEGGMLGDGSW